MVPPVILGISSGTRSMGLALFRGGELVDWRVVGYKGKWSQTKLSTILARLDAACRYSSVTCIAIKHIDPCYVSGPLQQLAEGITRYADSKGMAVDEYSIHDLQEAAGKRYRSAKKSIADYVSDAYPALRKEYSRERNNQRNYYHKMFEAVLCAEISNKKRY